jgi:hypothetical protein
VIQDQPPDGATRRQARRQADFPTIAGGGDKSRSDDPPSPNKPSRVPEEFISTLMDVHEPCKLIVTDNDVVMNEAQPSRQEPSQDKATVAKPQALLWQFFILFYFNNLLCGAQLQSAANHTKQSTAYRYICARL